MSIPTQEDIEFETWLDKQVRKVKFSKRSCTLEGKCRDSIGGLCYASRSVFRHCKKRKKSKEIKN